MKTKLSVWTSKYTLESKEATKGKLKEVFRGRSELDHYIGKVGSVVVHSIPCRGAFNITLGANRIFYVWENVAEIVINAEGNPLEENQKVSIDSTYSFVTIGNNSQHTSLIVEVSSLPYLEEAYKTIGEANIKHIHIRATQDTKDFLDEELNQITVHNFGPYSFGGNHYHVNEKKEMFLVAEGLVHIFEKKVDESVEGFGVEEILKRIESKDRDNVIQHDSYGQGGVFSFEPVDRDKQRISHATASGKTPAKFIELTNVAFDPLVGTTTCYPYILVPKDYDERKKLLDRLERWAA